MARCFVLLEAGVLCLLVFVVVGDAIRYQQNPRYDSWTPRLIFYAAAALLFVVSCYMLRLRRVASGLIGVLTSVAGSAFVHWYFVAMATE